MKVVVSAYSCEPHKGSEPGTGWHMVRHLAEHHDLWVFTRVNNRPHIEAALARDPIKSLRFVYHDIHSLLRAKKTPGGAYWYHYLWHLSLAKSAGALHQRVGFDVAHQLTWGSFRYPGSLHKLPIPFVLGPIGGAEEIPWSFWRSFGVTGMAKEALRVASNRIALVDPLLRRGYQSAVLVLAVTDETAEYVRRLTPSRTPIRLLPSIGVSVEDVGAINVDPDDQDPNQPVRVLFVGRLLHWKGVHLAIEAFARAREAHPALTLTILGQGPLERRLSSLVDRLGLTQAVSFIGRLPTLDDVYELYRTHDIFLFLSLHDSGGSALIEAMAAGLPVVCVGVGGPALSVDDSAGFRTRSDKTEHAVADAEAALVTLARDAGQRSRMGEAGRRRVATGLYSWPLKAAEIAAAYDGIVSS